MWRLSGDMLPPCSGKSTERWQEAGAKWDVHGCCRCKRAVSAYVLSVNLAHATRLSIFDRLTPCNPPIERCAQPQCILNMSTTMIANSSSGLRLSAPFAGTQPVRRSISAPRARYANLLNNCRRCQFSQLPHGDTHLRSDPHCTALHACSSLTSFLH
jgi:hypothetical protein